MCVCVAQSLIVLACGAVASFRWHGLGCPRAARRYYGDEHAFVYHFDEEGDVKGYVRHAQRALAPPLVERHCSDMVATFGHSYHTSDGSNSYFQMATEESIAMGGGGHFAFFLVRFSPMSTYVPLHITFGRMWVRMPRRSLI